jgi:hypothetical protein
MNTVADIAAQEGLNILNVLLNNSIYEIITAA